MKMKQLFNNDNKREAQINDFSELTMHINVCLKYNSSFYYKNTNILQIA